MTTAAALHTPWTTTDHDPICTPDDHSHSARYELAMARADIQDALHTEHHQRLTYALSARDHAAAVLDAPDSTPSDRQDATHYLVDAEAVIASTTEDSDD